MMKMWKKLLTSLSLGLMLLAPVTVDATEMEIGTTEVETPAESYVFDDAGLLTSAEIAELEEQIAATKEKTGWDIFAVTTNDAQGKSAMAYADDFYDARTSEDSNGILVLIDMDNREIYISTCGDAIRYLTDQRIEYILDDGFYYVSEGEYASCLSAMISGAERYFDAGIPQNQYNYDVETGAVSEYRSLTWMEVVPVLLLAVGAGAAFYFIVAKSYKHKGLRYEYPYMKYGKVDLTDFEDRFIRESVTHQRIQTSSSSGGSHRSSGGRSSTHRSSSGRSHGGGGRRF